jgi:hypothetical protein
VITGFPLSREACDESHINDLVLLTPENIPFENKRASGRVYPRLSEPPPENRKARAGGPGLGSGSANLKSLQEPFTEISAAEQGARLVDRHGHLHSEAIFKNWSPAAIRALGIRRVSEEGGWAMSKWRQLFKVHPGADVFPMMSDEELAKLGEDIEATGLKHQIILTSDGLTLLDGRNRLEPMERAGIPLNRSVHVRHYGDGDSVALVIASNIRRRHLTKEQQADLIVAAHRASRQVGEVPKRHVKGKPGSEKDSTKAAAIATAKEHGIGKRTVERSFAKAEGKRPEQSKKAGPSLKSKPKLGTGVGIEAARRYYLECCAAPDVDLDAERAAILNAFQEIAGKSLMAGQAAKIADWPDLPDELNRKLNKEMLAPE